MRAWLLPAFTGIPSMTLGEAPDPTPEKGQVVLDVHYASLNPADAYLALGQYPGKPIFPHILGRDAVGIVSALGPDVKDIAVGDKRIILRSYVGVTKPGTLAQRVAVDASYTAPVPEGWSDTQAAAAPLVYLTAWQALTQWGEMPPASIILVSGASGGVGVATVQLAKALGHRVAALSRSAEKSEKLRDLGADWTLDPQNANWPGELKKILDAAPAIKTQNSETKTPTAPRVDLAIDNIGGETFTRMLDVMGNNGRISCVGRLAGPVPNFNTASLFFRRLKVGGVAVGTYTNAEAVAAWHSVLDTLAKTNAKPLVDHIFPFEEVPAAFARLAEGPMGKVLVQVAG
jgi:NADPH2:quinone reductase